VAAPLKPTKTRFGALVRRYRLLRNLNHTQLGDVIGVAKSTAADMETGPVRSRPVEQILKLVEYFDVPLKVWAAALQEDGVDIAYIMKHEAWSPDVLEIASHAERLPPEVRQSLLVQARALDKEYGQDPEPSEPAAGQSVEDDESHAAQPASADDAPTPAHRA
jgi:transcriptional regulator with XRE-family HTH domain